MCAVKRSRPHLRCGQAVKQQKRWSKYFDPGRSCDYSAYGSDHPLRAAGSSFFFFLINSVEKSPGNHKQECKSVACRGSASIRNLYSYVTSSGDIRYDNRSYAAIVQRKSRVRGQISAPSVPSCVCANELSFKICVFQVVKSPQSRRDRCYCYRRHVRTL